MWTATHPGILRERELRCQRAIDGVEADIAIARHERDKLAIERLSARWRELDERVEWLDRAPERGYFQFMARLHARRLERLRARFSRR